MAGEARRQTRRVPAAAALPFLCVWLWVAGGALAQDVRTGEAAYSDWRSDAPGVIRRILPSDMPAPYASRSVSRGPSVIAQPEGFRPKAPPGFRVERFASGLDMPRTMRTAPNGDVFLAESGAGQIRVFRPATGRAKPEAQTVFASGLSLPFGIAFWPPGPNPSHVYVAETGRVVRYPYANGDMRATARPEVIVLQLPEGGHWTRDIVFSPDGKRMFVSIGSSSNVATSMPARPPPGWESTEARGSAWGDERARAMVVAFDPDGRNRKVSRQAYAIAWQRRSNPKTGALWCVVNERDGLGTICRPTMRGGAGRGVLWLALVLYRSQQDPRLKDRRPDLRPTSPCPTC